MHQVASTVWVEDLNDLDKVEDSVKNTVRESSTDLGDDSQTFANDELESTDNLAESTNPKKRTSFLGGMSRGLSGSKFRRDMSPISSTLIVLSVRTVFTQQQELNQQDTSAKDPVALSVERVANSHYGTYRSVRALIPILMSLFLFAQSCYLLPTPSFRVARSETSCADYRS